MFVLLTLFLSVLAIEKHKDHVFAPEEIIELPMGRFPDPECEYSVRRNDENGPVVHNQVHVGDPLYHSWSCSHGGRDTGLYCIMVHNCTVRSSQTSRDAVPILDEFGCSLFPTVLPHVEYSKDLRGGLFVHAFSLDVDQPAVFFECHVKFLLKLNGHCRRPTCPPLEKLQQGGS
ncbi:unnamed protein product [Auanema sp. JU1783]|nr:unnamed protein product [Auanema sp. JU1783]